MGRARDAKHCGSGWIAWGRRSNRSTHVPMCIAIPPKYSVASVIGFLKGKSAIAVARLCGREQNFTGEHRWARGYAVSTVGFELDQIRQYIREPEEADGTGRF